MRVSKLNDEEVKALRAVGFDIADDKESAPCAGTAQSYFGSSSLGRMPHVATQYKRKKSALAFCANATTTSSPRY